MLKRRIRLNWKPHGCLIWISPHAHQWSMFSHLYTVCCSSDTDMHILMYKRSITLTFQLGDKCSGFLPGLGGGERWWVSYREQSVPIMEILKGEGGLLIELGRDAIMSGRLARLPTTPPQDSLYPHAGKRYDSGEVAPIDSYRANWSLKKKKRILSSLFSSLLAFQNAPIAKSFSEMRQPNTVNTSFHICISMLTAG